MPDLLDLLYPWPVVSTLAQHLGVGDLIQLSRVNTGCRAALHGFPRPRPDDGAGDWIRVRAEIFIGRHQSAYWLNLKSLAPMSCAEANHRRGYRAEMCRYCSIPVCDACVVRVRSSHHIKPKLGFSFPCMANSNIGVLWSRHQRMADENAASLRRLLGPGHASQEPQFQQAAHAHSQIHFCSRRRRLLSLHSNRRLALLGVSEEAMH